MNRQDTKDAKTRENKRKIRKKCREGIRKRWPILFLFFSLSGLGVLGVLAVHFVTGFEEDRLERELKQKVEEAKNVSPADE